jgi:hypothetical protein
MAMVAAATRQRGLYSSRAYLRLKPSPDLSRRIGHVCLEALLLLLAHRPWALFAAVTVWNLHTENWFQALLRALVSVDECGNPALLARADLGRCVRLFSWLQHLLIHLRELLRGLHDRTIGPSYDTFSSDIVSRYSRTRL